MKNYTVYAFLIAAILLSLFFLLLERKKLSASKITLAVTLCAIASVGRVVFGFIPQVQPVTVIVIIAGAALGPRWGFLVGVMSAFCSNMVMGQGPWTPFQMLAWGTIGLIGGWVLQNKLKNNMLVICTFAFFSGLFFSLITDIYTITSIGEAINFSMILSIFAAGLLFNISHAVGNVVFALILYKPMTTKILRAKKKYANI